jgi:predicted ATPase
MNTEFKNLHLYNWRQFRNVDIKFHKRLTVLTGANGAGKTTLLNLLGRHFGWNIAFISTGRLNKRGVAKYYSGRELLTGPPDDSNRGSDQIGRIIYGDNTESTLSVPSGEVGQVFNVQLQNQQPVKGLFLPSHRPVYSYREVDQIPTKISAREELFNQYYSNMRSMYEPQTRYDSPSFRLKSALVSLATFGYGNQVVAPNAEAVETFEGFEKILRLVLPKRLGFQKISVQMPEVVLECSSGPFSLDAASGGVAAIIDVAWQLYMKNLLDPNFVAVFDEPENHLHPEMQRSMMPGLLNAFPGVQFIVATHNPFIVTSVEDSAVIVLNYVDDRVVSSRLDEVDRSASANRVLTDVLGLPAPIPLWVQDRLDQVIGRFTDRELTADSLSELRADLQRSGLGSLFPDVINRLVGDTQG